MSKILRALETKYEAEIAAAQANIDIYLHNSVGIGEYSDLVQAVDSQIEKMAAAEEKLHILRATYPNATETSI